MSTGRRDVWEDYWQRFELDAVSDATARITARAAADLIGRRADRGESLHVLDLGCGDGYLSTRLVEQLGEELAPLVVGTDLASSLGRRVPEGVVPLAQADAIHLPFRDGSFDVVVSFGYSSVASYDDERIRREIARVLKANGALIADFRNHLALWFLLRPQWVLRWIGRYLGFGKRQAQLATFGLRKTFASAGLRLEGTRFLLTFPPTGRFSSSWLMTIERRLDVFVLSRLFGRIFLAVFRR